MEEIETLIKELKPARADGVAVPWRSPDGYIHLSIAMAKVASAMFQNAWEPWQETYPHILKSCIAAADGSGPCEPTDKGSGEQLVRFMLDSFRWEVVTTGHRAIGGGGPVQKIPGDWWDLEDIDLRFRTWSIDPSDVLSSRVDLPHWIWVESKSLDMALRKISSARAGGGLTKQYDPAVWAKFGDALEFLTTVTPAMDNPVGYLVMLCQTAVTRAQAGLLEQSFRKNLVLRESLWPIPYTLWEKARPDPRSSPADGTIYFADGDTEYLLRDVLVEVPTLYSYLARNGFSPSSEGGRSESPGLNQASEASPAGRKRGQDTYVGDAAIVQRIIDICDSENLPLPKAINRVIADVEPMHLDDAAKKKRIRPKVLTLRPDLRP